MSETAARPTGGTVDFTLDEGGLEACREALDELTEKGRVLLNQWVHDASFFHGRSIPGDVPRAYRSEAEDLTESPLLVEAGEGYVVPEDVKYLPEGPGVRRDQLPGLFHRLPEQSLRDWYGLVGEEDPGSMPEWLLYRRLATGLAERSRNLGNSLTDVWPDRSEAWVRTEALGADPPARIENFYASLDPEASDLSVCLAAGAIVPVWDDDGRVNEYVLESSRRERRTGERTPDPEREDHREVEWERKPFTPAEQLKFLMLAADAVPFRLTRDREPHRFDLKEVARVSEWSGEHLEYLTFLLLENGYLVADEDRFYITELGQEWDRDSGTVDPFFTRCGPPVFDNGDGAGPRASDLTVGLLLREGLALLDRVDGGVRAEEAVGALVEEPGVADSVLGLPGSDVPLDEHREDLVGGLYETLHDFGLTDRREDDDTVYYRLNERGGDLLESELLRGPENEELPYILQPDGQLLVPLESPLEEFRRLNPFALLVKADRMIGYQIDRQSLVQALNEGWNAGSFLDFLREKTDSIPEPLEDLFEDTIGNVRSINVEEVHHLIEFEDGATTAKAANILNNYDPQRIDETTLVLRSETSPKTIRRNLSRGGIRLSGGDVDAGRSPLKDSSND